MVIPQLLYIRNQIAQITSRLPMDCTINIKTDEQILKQVLAGIKNPIVEIANGNLTVDKDVQFLKVLTAFRP